MAETRGAVPRRCLSARGRRQGRAHQRSRRHRARPHDFLCDLGRAARRHRLSRARRRHARSPSPATITGESKEEIIHIPAAGAGAAGVGEALRLAIDWERRYRLMRMHTACHLLTVVCPFPITGAAVAEDDSRVDFDIPEAGFTKEEVTRALNELVAANHPVFTRWITDEELAANPGLVKSKNVRPPAGTGRIRLVCIGDNAVGRQPALRRHACRRRPARSARSTSARSRRRAARTAASASASARCRRNDLASPTAASTEDMRQKSATSGTNA